MVLLAARNPLRHAILLDKARSFPSKNLNLTSVEDGQLGAVSKTGSSGLRLYRKFFNRKRLIRHARLRYRRTQKQTQLFHLQGGFWQDFRGQLK